MSPGKGLTQSICPRREGEALSKGARALHRTHVCEVSPCLGASSLDDSFWHPRERWGCCCSEEIARDQEKRWKGGKAPLEHLTPVIAVVKMTPILPGLSGEGERNLTSQSFEGASLVLFWDLGDFQLSGKPKGLGRGEMKAHSWKPHLGVWWFGV